MAAAPAWHEKSWGGGFFFMAIAAHGVGDRFPIQFAWRLPEGDYLRAVFEAEVLRLVEPADKYVVRLSRLVAGREETAEGEMKAQEAFSADYWGLVGRLVGRVITVAYEAEDGRALHMRLETLTGEHDFFFRYH